MQIEFLGERYQIQDPIGRGGMATIYRGRDLRTDHIVAIKILREVYSTDPKFVTRFQREAKAAAALQHPNIVQVYDYGQSEGNYFIVMECIEGTDLRRYLRSRGVLAVDRVIMIAHDIALGLGAAHRRQIVHRDVKPQNILVGRDGSIKLTDFGIASVYKDINDERLTTTGMTLGTVQYYAPEQAQGEIVNPAADVYALGIVMYEMLTGRTPFDGDTPVAVAMQHIQDLPVPPSQHNPNIPPALEAIVMRCLEKIPEMRYRDGNALARAIEVLSEGDAAGAKRCGSSALLVRALLTQMVIARNRMALWVEVPIVLVLLQTSRSIIGRIKSIVLPIMVLLLHRIAGQHQEGMLPMVSTLVGLLSHLLKLLLGWVNMQALTICLLLLTLHLPVHFAKGIFFGRKGQRSHASSTLSLS